MSYELPPPPNYPFPDTIEDHDLLHKIHEYGEAVLARNEVLGLVGWQAERLYFAGHIKGTFQRCANKITIDPDEAISKLEIGDEEGVLLPGFSVAAGKGQLIIGYNGPTDGRYFDTMDRLIQWGQELSAREENATIRDRVGHSIRRLGIVR